MYGSLVFEPEGGEPVKADRDHVVVLSDWTREHADEVIRTLARGSDWYAFKKGTTQSLSGAAKAGAAISAAAPFSRGCSAGLTGLIGVEAADGFFPWRFRHRQRIGAGVFCHPRNEAAGCRARGNRV